MPSIIGTSPSVTGAEQIILDPSEVATNRIELDISAFVSVDGIDWGDAAIEAYMADTSRGSTPIDYRIPNRTITIPFKLSDRPSMSFTDIRTKLQAKVARFHAEGGWIKRTTPIGTVYADIVNATLHYGGDWFQSHRSIDIAAVLTLEVLPDWYQDEITLDDMVETTNAELVQVLKLTGSTAVIKGDLPGRVRVVVDNDSTAAQGGLIWGFRSWHYSNASTAALAYEAEALTPLDAAALATITGASGATNNVVRHNSLPQNAWTPVLSTTILSGSLDMTHTGTYRIWARVYTTSAPPPQIRFLYDIGDFVYPEENAAATIPGANNFYDIDLGQLRLDAVPAGTHRWRGMVQAFGSYSSNVSIDRVWFAPVDDGYAVVRGNTSTSIQGLTATAAQDGFDQTAGALTGKTLPIGGTWVGAGDTDDFAVSGASIATRVAVSDADVNTGRYMTASTPTLGAVQVYTQLLSTTGALSLVTWGVIARYTDSNNWLMARIEFAAGVSRLRVIKRVASVVTTLSDVAITPTVTVPASVFLAIDVAGNYTATAVYPGAPTGGTPAAGQDAALATGGALATGKVGFYDAQTSATANTRTYDAFTSGPLLMDAAIYGSQSAELRTEGMFREDAAGVAYGPISSVIGSLPRIPPSGLEGLPVEIFLKASRGDLDRYPDGGIDDISARVYYRPSWLLIPGA